MYDVSNVRVRNQMRMMPTRFCQHLRRSAHFTSKTTITFVLMFNVELSCITQDLCVRDKTLFKYPALIMTPCIPYVGFPIQCTWPLYMGPLQQQLQAAQHRSAEWGHAWTGTCPLEGKHLILVMRCKEADRRAVFYSSVITLTALHYKTASRTTWCSVSNNLHITTLLSI